MNPIFAALTAVVFGLLVLGGEASAAPQPTHATPARKVAPAAKPVAKPAPKSVSKSASKAAAP